MHKILVERPRRGHKDGPATSRMERRTMRKDVRMLDEDSEAFNTKASIKRHTNRPGRDRKELNENLNPLYRFLDSRVGKKWDDVFSEICEQVNMNNPVQYHIRQHLDDMVELHVIMKDNKPHVIDTWMYRSSGNELRELYSTQYHPTFYVHPTTGLLAKAPIHKRWRSPKPKLLDFIKHPTNPLIQYYNVDGEWREVIFRRPTKDELERGSWGRYDKIRYFDRITNLYRVTTGWVRLEQSIFPSIHTSHEKFGGYIRYFGAHIYPVECRTLSTKEIKKVKHWASKKK